MEQQQNQILKPNQIQIKPDCSILLAGKRRSGKTIFITNLLYEMTNKYDYHSIILFSDTHEIESNSAFKNIINKNCCFKSEQLDDKIDIILNYQKKHKKDNQYMLIILDDMNLSKKSKGGLQLLFSQGRHYNICIILSVQFPKILCDNIVRSNLDVIICSKLNYTGMEAVYECLNVQFPKKKFFNFVQDNTQDHKFVMYNGFDENDNELKIVKADFIEINKK